MYDVKPEDETEMECSVIYITHEDGRLELTFTCKHFEYLGWLCKHCIRILDNNNIKRIPEEYVLQRWTKTSKDKVWDRVNHKNTSNVNAQVINSCYNNFYVLTFNSYVLSLNCYVLTYMFSADILMISL